MQSFFVKTKTLKSLGSFLILHKIKQLLVRLQLLLEWTVLFFESLNIFCRNTLNAFFTDHLLLFIARWCRACCSWCPTVFGPSRHQKQPLNMLQEHSHWSIPHSGFPDVAPRHSRWWSELPPLLSWWKSWKFSLPPGYTDAGASTGQTEPPRGAERTHSHLYLLIIWQANVQTGHWPACSVRKPSWYRNSSHCWCHPTGSQSKCGPLMQQQQCGQEPSA